MPIRDSAATPSNLPAATLAPAKTTRAARTAASPALRQFVAVADSMETWAEEELAPWAAEEEPVPWAVEVVASTAVEVEASTAVEVEADRMAAVGANPPAMHY